MGRDVKGGVEGLASWQFYERALIDHENAFRNITKTHFKKCIKRMEEVYKNASM